MRSIKQGEVGAEVKADCTQRRLVLGSFSGRIRQMNSAADGQIKKRVGRERPSTPRERLDQLWQLYLFWKSTPAGQQEQRTPPHVRKIVRKAA